ncbi:stAR-related lipid transfer protein 7, mitochondrial-like [Styela clava]
MSKSKQLLRDIRRLCEDFHLRQYVKTKTSILHGWYLRNQDRNISVAQKYIKSAGTQCNVYIAQRLRRLHKIYLLYQQAYKEHAKIFLFYPIIRTFSCTRSAAFTFAACGFQFCDAGFSDHEIDKQIGELLEIKRALRCNNGIILPDSSWQNVLDDSDIKMWKHYRNDLRLTEYKVHGTFNDISAKMFFNIQVDMEYRKTWDDLVVKLEVIEADPSRDEQVLQWVTQLPRPFAPREYLCIRRTLVDDKNKVMVISAKAVNHPSCPPSNDFVRVTSYESHMVIKPHKSFDDLGFDYLMTYCDDPQIVLPTRLASWVISAGVPQYINKLHDACIQFGQKAPDSIQSVSNYLVS